MSHTLGPKGTLAIENQRKTKGKDLSLGTTEGLFGGTVFVTSWVELRLTGVFCNTGKAAIIFSGNIPSHGIRSELRCCTYIRYEDGVEARYCCRSLYISSGHL